MTGAGAYRIGGEVAVQQEMTLDLDIAGTARHLDSGLVQVQMLWPHIEISVDNRASSRVAERAGYVREGMLRSLHVKQDLRSDTEVWSLLPSDVRP